MQQSQPNMIPETGAGLSQQTLSDLWRLFDRLVHYRNDATELQSFDLARSDWGEHKDALMEVFLDPIEDKLSQLAWLAVDLPANSVEEQQIKARILSELIEEGEPDVGNALTRSLIRDIMS